MGHLWHCDIETYATTTTETTHYYCYDMLLIGCCCCYCSILLLPTDLPTYYYSSKTAAAAAAAAAAHLEEYRLERFCAREGRQGLLAHGVPESRVKPLEQGKREVTEEKIRAEAKMDGGKEGRECKVRAAERRNLEDWQRR